MDPGQIKLARDDGTELQLHHGSVYRVNRFEPYDQTVRADQGGPNPWQDGSWSGAEWREAATVPMELGIHTESEAELMAAWWALRAALNPVRTGGDVELTWNTSGTEYLMYARPGKTTLRKEGSTGIGWVTTQVGCPDPGIYSAEEHVAAIGLLHRIGGLAAPFGTPFGIHTTAADGEAALSNAFTGQARLRLHLTGPVVAPRISLITGPLVEILYLDTTLGADDYLDIDTKDKSVVLNGATSRLADQYGAWPLLTGDALIRFEADVYAPGARLTITHRDTH